MTPFHHHNKDSTGEMNPEELYKQLRLLFWVIIQEVMFFLFHKFLLYILYFKDELMPDFYDFPVENVVERPPGISKQ